MAILNQFELKKPIRATQSNSNFWFKFANPRSGLTQKQVDMCVSPLEKPVVRIFCPSYFSSIALYNNIYGSLQLNHETAAKVMNN